MFDAVGASLRITLFTMVVSLSGTDLSAAAERPNIIFILADDQRRDSLGCYGNDFVKTPHLDQLAEDGVLFKNASITSAICTPSRVCFFLGQYERRHGINFNSGTSLAPEAWKKSYPVALRENGYFTGYVGKNHVPIGVKGYETALMEKSFDFWYAGHGHLTFYPKDRHRIFKSAKADTQVEVVGEGTSSFLNSAEDFMEGAQAFLDRRPTNKPFCLSICLNVPHGAGTSSMKMLPSDPELYRTAYRDQINEMPLPPNFVPKEGIQTPKLPSEVLYAEYRQKGYNYVDAEDSLRERMIRQYQTITGIDLLIGRLRDQLKQLGLEANTVILFSSDHGLMLGEYGLGGKALNYESCLQVPMIIYDPRQPDSARGRRLDPLVQSIDVAPTLLDMADVRIPRTMQGRSMVRFLEGKSTRWRRYAFGENLWSTVFGNPRIESVRSARWKYLRYFENDPTPWEGLVEGPEAYRMQPGQAELYANWLVASIKGEAPIHEELYDLESDPGETTNLAGDPAHSRALAKMRKECQKLVRAAKGDVSQPAATVALPEKAKPR